MEKTKFDEDFQRLTTEMVEVAFEYIGRNKEEVDNVYIYGSMEDDVYFFNVFYQINAVMAKKQDVNNLLIKKIDSSSQRQNAVMSIGNEMLLELSDVFIDDAREVPALLKMTYSPKTGKFNCDIIYEPQYYTHPEWTNVNVFENWYMEEKTGDKGTK